jgi:hypothetical protein
MQLNRLAPKLTALKKIVPQVKVWYEFCYETEQDMLIRDPNKVDFLSSLHVLNTKKELGFHGIDNRQFLNAASFLNIIINKEVSHLDDLDIQEASLFKTLIFELFSDTIRKHNNRLAQRMNWECDIFEKKAGVFTAFQELAYENSTPPESNTLYAGLSNVFQRIYDVETQIETSLNDLLLQGKLPYSLSLALSKTLNDTMDSYVQALMRIRNALFISKTDPKFCSAISGSIYPFFDIHFIIEYLRNAHIKKHILFAGATHIFNIAEFFKKMNFTITFQSGPMNAKNTYELVNVSIIAGVDQQDFDYVKKKEFELMSSQELLDLISASINHHSKIRLKQVENMIRLY